MTNVSTSHSLLLEASLLGAVILAAWLLLGGPGGPVAAWTDLDLHYLALPVALGCGLMLLNRLLLLARLTAFGRDAVARLIAVGDERGVGRRLLASAPLALTRLPLDLGRMVLVLGVLSSVSNLPATISARPGGPDLTSLPAYFEAFDSLGVWGAIILLPFALVRAATEARPAMFKVFRFPLARLVAFGAAYVLMADGGVLSVAFDLQGSMVLLGFGLALGLSYGASTLRRVIAAARPDRDPRLRRAALIILEGAWVAALLSSGAALSSAVEPALAGLEARQIDAYLAMLGSLSGVAAAVFLPFILVRAIGVYVPMVDRVVGFPAAHLLLFLAVYVVFAPSGVVATALEFNPSQLMVVLTQALALSYAALVLRNISVVGVPGLHGRLAALALGLASLVARAAAIALAALVVLNHLPVINALLLDHSQTYRIGVGVLPGFGSLFEARYIITALCFVTAIALSLPRAHAYEVLGRYSSILAAFVYGTAALLAWVIGTGMANLGHGLVLGGALAGTGMYFMALSHLAVYAERSSNRIIADLSGWLAESRIRALLLGMNIAFYVLLLRPVLYEYLWLAPLYEYAALLVLMLVILTRVVNLLRTEESADSPESPAWTDWSHHRQSLASRPDRRMEITAGLRQAFVERGEWKTLWTYMMGLLHRSGASVESVRKVCRPLRNSASSGTIRSLLGMRKWDQAGRAEALEESLERLGQALSSPETPTGTIGEDDLRGAARVYIESGVELDALAVALIMAHCQRGEGVAQAVERWFYLLEVPDAPPRWYRSLERHSPAATADEGQRLRLVEDAISLLSVGDTPRDRVTVGSPA